MDHDEKLVSFAKDLKVLMKNYNAYIGGCGCCGSPFLEMGGKSYDDLTFDERGITWTEITREGERIEVTVG